MCMFNSFVPEQHIMLPSFWLIGVFVCVCMRVRECNSSPFFLFYMHTHTHTHTRDTKSTLHFKRHTHANTRTFAQDFSCQCLPSMLSSCWIICGVFTDRVLRQRAQEGRGRVTRYTFGHAPAQYFRPHGHRTRKAHHPAGDGGSGEGGGGGCVWQPPLHGVPDESSWSHYSRHRGQHQEHDARPHRQLHPGFSLKPQQCAGESASALLTLLRYRNCFWPMLERWGAGVETHFQEISWNLRPVVNGT